MCRETVRLSVHTHAHLPDSHIPPRDIIQRVHLNKKGKNIQTTLADAVLSLLLLLLLILLLDVDCCSVVLGAKVNIALW